MPAIGERVVAIGRGRSIILGVLRGTAYRGGVLYAIVENAARIRHEVPVLELRKRGTA